MIEFVLPTSSRTQSLDRMPRSAVTLLLGSAVNARVSPARLPMVQIGLPFLQAAHGDRARPPGRCVTPMRWKTQKRRAVESIAQNQSLRDYSVTNEKRQVDQLAVSR
jgi:hypothetical protein